MVILKCCVPNCQRANFKTVYSLIKHTSHKNGVHRKNGLFQSNDHAIEVCGQVIPSQQQQQQQEEGEEDVHNEDGGLRGLDNKPFAEATTPNVNTDHPPGPLLGNVRRRKRSVRAMENDTEGMIQVTKQTTPTDQRYNLRLFDQFNKGFSSELEDANSDGLPGLVSVFAQNAGRQQDKNLSGSVQRTLNPCSTLFKTCEQLKPNRGDQKGVEAEDDLTPAKEEPC